MAHPLVGWAALHNQCSPNDTGVRFCDDIFCGESAMTGRRVRLVVEVSLDPVPGWGNDAEDYRRHVQRLLDDTIGHYGPVVTVEGATA